MNKMKDFLTKIWDGFSSFLNKMFSDTKVFLLVIVSIIALCLYFNLRSARNELDNIIIEKTDSLSMYENKIGELYKEIDTYITDIDHLKQSNTALYNEVKNLKDNPIIVTKIVTETVIEEKVLKDTVEVLRDQPDVYIIRQTYNDNFLAMDLTTQFDYKNVLSTTTLNSAVIPATFTLDLIESKKGDLSFIVKSDNPYIKINNVNGAVLSPEDSKAIKKRYDDKWCLVVGVGPAFTIVDNKPKCYPAAQVTFGFKIFSF